MWRSKHSTIEDVVDILGYEIERCIWLVSQIKNDVITGKGN